MLKKENKTPMDVSIQKRITPSSRLIITATLFLAFVGFSLGVPDRVWAEPVQSDPVQAHCLKVVPAKASSACKGTENKNIDKARTLASYKCDGESIDNGDAADCVVKEAKGYISDAAKKTDKNDSAKDFEKNLDAELKKERAKLPGSSLTKPNPNLGSKSPAGGSGCQNGVCLDPAVSRANCTRDRCDFIGKYVNPAVNLLTIIFGLIAVISIIFGGIQYSASGGDPQKVTQAKQRIQKTIIAIVAYFLLYAFLQFIVPGGIFKAGP